MACRYIFAGKEYAGPQEFRDALSALSPAEAAKYVPGIEAVPDAPFIGKTEEWSGLAMRRMLRYAAENGFDRVAWTKGEQQAERYDLSKQVSRVQVVGKPDGTYDIWATPRETGHETELATGVSRAKVADYIGKEAAEKINEQFAAGEKIATLSGDGLRVGGEGMRGFYDQILPGVASKLGKKFGAKVGETQLGEDIANFKKQATEDINVKPWAVIDDRGGPPRVKQQYETRIGASGALDVGQGTYLVNLKNPEGLTSAHSMDITDQMKRSVLEEGQPLFKAGQSGAKKPLTVDMVKAAIPGLEFSEMDGAFVAALKNGGELRVTPVGEIEVSPRARQALEASAKAAGEEGVPSPVGQYQRFGKDSLIKVAEGYPDGTVEHEGFHFVFEQALSEGERAAVLKRYGGEEEAAYAYADWAKSRKFGNSWFSKIMAYAKRIVHAFKPTWESTFEETASGRVAGRVKGAAAQGGERFAVASAAKEKPPVQEEIPGTKTAEPGPAPKVPTKFDKWLEFWRAGLVSAPGTHAANVLGNAGDVAFRLGETATSAVLDPILGGKRSRLKGEARAEFAGAMRGASAGLGQLGKALKDIARLEPEKVDPTRPEEYRQGAIGGNLGRAVRIPFRLLGAMDDYAKVVGGSAELHKLAWREAKGDATKAAQLIEKPTAEMREAVEKSKLSRTFQDPNALAQSIIKLRSDHKWLNVFVPFAQTPAALAVSAWKRSPAGFFEGYKALQEFKAAQRRGDKPELVQKLKGEALDALAKPMLGTLLLGTFAGVAKAGGMTGSGPTDPREKNALRETGWQPYSFVVETNGKKTYIPFNRFEPVSTLLGFAADMAEAKESKTAGDLFDKGLGSIAQNFTSKTYLQGLSDAAELISDPKRSASQWISSFAGSQIPNVVAKAAQAIDPVMRETNVGEPGVAGVAKRLARTVASRTPGVSSALNPRRSATGEEIVRPGNAASRFLSPVQVTSEKPEADLERLMVSSGYVPGQPAREATVKGRKVRFSDDEYRLLQDANEKAAETVRGYLRRGSLSRLPETIEEGGARSKAGVIRDVFNRERDRARQRIYRSADFRRRMREL